MANEKTKGISSQSPYSSSLCCLSRGSHFDTSLYASSLARAGARLPTSVVERKSRTAWLHLASARRS